VTVGTPDLATARALVDAAHEGAKDALIELRDLARGLYPPVLDNGLADALATLAAGTAVPVELGINVPLRPSAAIETITYFCAAQLFTNAAGSPSRPSHVLRPAERPRLDATGGRDVRSLPGRRHGASGGPPAVVHADG
jgi:hypothetical protein